MTEIFLTLLLGLIAFGEIPGFHFNRASLAFCGAVIILVSGILPVSDAFAAIDWNTLVLLLSMMIFTAHLRLAGFFDGLAITLAQWKLSPPRLLALVCLSSALLSAVLINDTIALMLTPLLIEVTLAARLNPLPYLIGLAVSSNIGSMATPIGNPQNILIAAISGLGFPAFLGHLGIPMVLSLALAFGLICWRYHRQWTLPGPPKHLPHRPAPIHRPLLRKCALAFGLMLGGFLSGQSLVLSALAGAAILLMTRRVKPTKVFRLIDGSLFILFSALFIITRAMAATPGFQALVTTVSSVLHENIAGLALVGATLSNLVSNVPAVMLLSPLVQASPQPNTAWLVLAGITTLAGNLTLLGSVANLIVAETARPLGIRLSFVEYLKVGLPLALLSMVLTTGWLIFTLR